MTSRGTARPRYSAVLGRGRPLLCASPLLVSEKGLGVQRYKLGGMKLAGLEGARDKCISGED